MTPGPPSSLDASPQGLPAIGPTRARAYADAGLLTRRDLLYHLPVRYRVRPPPVTIAELVDGERAAVAGEVVRARVRRRGPRSTVSLLLQDEAGNEVLVLLFNRAYLAKSLKKGTRLWAAGKAEVPATPEDGDVPRLLAADYRVLPAAEVEAEGDEAAAPGKPAALALPDDGDLLPIYKLPVGIPPRTHRKAVLAVLAEGIEDWRETTPGEPTLQEAFAAIHAATDLDAAREARARLARDEAFALSLDVAARRAEAGGAERAVELELPDRVHERLLELLPYECTGAQRRVIEELRRDMTQPVGGQPMARLLQGDVGSGKTMVAFYALLAAAACGRQGALMAPTEILAVQHADALQRLLEQTVGDRAPRVALLTGSGGAAFRREQRAMVTDGRALLAVGTHAAAGKTLEYHDLAVAVVDEQHRFGVRQRVRFRTKGFDTHLLVMTATPIPRTLTLTAYGELDVSLIDEMPPGRSPRKTEYVPPAKQDAMWRRLSKAVARGERGYVVCPAIREGEESNGQSVEEVFDEVVAQLGEGARVSAVHGALHPQERDEVLDAFRRGDVDVLVATVIIEVGLDVPEATFVVVPAPSRFGLATLHQVRGRVGRGTTAGACYLLGPIPKGPGRERIDALCNTDDGFELAEEDLRLRGPGELLGTRQSGFPGFLVMDPVQDVQLLSEAREAALEAARTMPPGALDMYRRRVFPRMELRPENLLAGG